MTADKAKRVARALVALIFRGTDQKTKDEQNLERQRDQVLRNAMVMKDEITRLEQALEKEEVEKEKHLRNAQSLHHRVLIQQEEIGELQEEVNRLQEIANDVG